MHQVVRSDYRKNMYCFDCYYGKPQMFDPEEQRKHCAMVHRNDPDYRSAFAEAIKKVVKEACDKHEISISTWDIGRRAFPEIWATPRRRGGLVSKIKSVGLTLVELGYLPAKDQWQTGEFYWKEEAK
jgi:hypothetical protein